MKKQIHFGLEPRKFISIALTCALLAGTAIGRAAVEADDQTVHLFTSFRGDGDGLHLAYSTDARNWTDLGRVFLEPKVGSRLLRDPHIVRGPDGLFHMVWTSGWSDQGIGYANSPDLVNWSEQRYLPLMENRPGTKTCWAPEVYYEASLGQYLIVWSSNVETPDVTPPKGGFHRAYYILTKDFKTFTEPKMLFDPGFNNIDTTMLKVNGRYHIVFKETDDQPAGIWGAVHGATADHPLGPYTLLPEPIIKNERVEGPALVNLSGKTLLYVDYYVNHRYGVRETSDWKSWTDVTLTTDVVRGQRHGSLLAITRAEMRKLEPNLDRTPPPPVLPGVNADPHIAVFGDTFFIYPTTDGTEGWLSTSFRAWSSRDLVNWKDEGVILDLPRDLVWADLRAWAPAIATKHGKYYYYYSAAQNIGVAVADSPAGPFKDPLGKPLVAKTDFPRMQAIDPMVFVDDDGSAFLYWGQGRCKAVQLNDDMISFETAGVRDLTPPGYNEGPFVHKRNGRYYLTWSEFDTRDPRYSVAYSTGDSPLGPFTKAPDNPILRQSGLVKGAGHHSLVQIPGRDEWVIAYHRFRIPGGNGYNRETCLSPLRHAEDGGILPVDVFEPVRLSPLNKLAWACITMPLTNAMEAPDPPRPGDIVFRTDFNTPESRAAWSQAPFATWERGYQGTTSLRITMPADHANGGSMIRVPLDLRRYRGCRLLFECMAKADRVSQPAEVWNGVKFMLHYASPTEGPQWHHPSGLHGTFDWQQLMFVAPIAQDADQGEIHLGLQDSSGSVWFDSLNVTVYKGVPPQRPQPLADPGPEFRGHDLPRLRGVMSPNTFRNEDLRVLGMEWNANVIRWQITRNWGRAGTDRDLVEYDRWFEGKLSELDQALEAAHRYGLKVVVDMHSPPGGRYENHDLAIFHEPGYQDHYVALWQKIARRYHGNPAVWGYDLINEPVQNRPSPSGVADYLGTQVRAATAIRAIDPRVPIFIEAAEWDSAAGFRELEPVALSNVIYQVHMYVPGEFTHQGVGNQRTGIAYPGKIGGVIWEKERLRRELQPVREFQLAYNVHIYVGEFSAIRWAPGAVDYLRDCIELFEEYGWDWTYHAYREWDGWSVEHGNDPLDHTPSVEPTDRLKLLLSWFARNEKPR